MIFELILSSCEPNLPFSPSFSWHSSMVYSPDSPVRLIKLIKVEQANV